MRDLRRLVAAAAALLTLLMPPVIAAAFGEAHHAPVASTPMSGHAGHGDAGAEGRSMDGPDARHAALWCQVACASLHALPAVLALPDGRLPRVFPDVAVAGGTAYVAEPDPPPPRRV